MLDRTWINAIASIAALLTTISVAHGFDDEKYPNLKGSWTRTVPRMPRFDSSKPRGMAQQAPLIPEYQARFEASLADQALGGQGEYVGFICRQWGMPGMMNAFEPMEITILPETTYIAVDDLVDSARRIFTDGRDWPTDVDPTYTGYSIGKWIDTDGNGRYDLLEVETRNFRGPRFYDSTGLRLHEDNQSVIKERIYLDKADPNTLHDEITVIDHALTRPWSVNKTYLRDPHPVWMEAGCAENNTHIRIGNEAYMLSSEGLLMPAKMGQAPPDLRYFKQPQK